MTYFQQEDKKELCVINNYQQREEGRGEDISYRPVPKERAAKPSAAPGWERPSWNTDIPTFSRWEREKKEKCNSHSLERVVWECKGDNCQHSVTCSRPYPRGTHQTDHAFSGTFTSRNLGSTHLPTHMLEGHLYPRPDPRGFIGQGHPCLCVCVCWVCKRETQTHTTKF